MNHHAHSGTTAVILYSNSIHYDILMCFHSPVRTPHLEFAISLCGFLSYTLGSIASSNHLCFIYTTNWPRRVYTTQGNRIQLRAEYIREKVRCDRCRHAVMTGSGILVNYILNESCTLCRVCVLYENTL